MRRTPPKLFTRFHQMGCLDPVCFNKKKEPEELIVDLTPCFWPSRVLEHCGFSADTILFHKVH